MIRYSGSYQTDDPASLANNPGRIDTTEVVSKYD